MLREAASPEVTKGSSENTEVLQDGRFQPPGQDRVQPPQGEPSVAWSASLEPANTLPKAPKWSLEKHGIHLHHRSDACEWDNFLHFTLKLCAKEAKTVDEDIDELEEEGNELQHDDDHWCTINQNFKKMWTKFDSKENPQLLRSIEIATDGGLNDEEMDVLWGKDCFSQCSRAWSGLQVVIALVGNVSFIVYSDITVLQEAEDDSDATGMYLLGQFLWKESKYSGEQIIVSLELSILIFMVLNAIYYFLAAMFQPAGCDRWRDVALLFFRRIPELTTFTAMKLLFYIDPWVIVTQTSLEFNFWKVLVVHGRYFRALWRVIRYTIWHVVCVFVGLNAFLVKFRQVGRDYVSKEEMGLADFLGCVGFLFQVLAVVNVTTIVRNRLFFFIFGGEDCIVSSVDKAKEMVWNALLARKIWQHHRFPKNVLVLLSFDDFDIQHLLLHMKKVK